MKGHRCDGRLYVFSLRINAAFPVPRSIDTCQPYSVDPTIEDPALDIDEESVRADAVGHRCRRYCVPPRILGAGQVMVDGELRGASSPRRS